MKVQQQSFSFIYFWSVSKSADTEFFLDRQFLWKGLFGFKSFASGQIRTGDYRIGCVNATSVLCCLPQLKCLYAKLIFVLMQESKSRFETFKKFVGEELLTKFSSFSILGRRNALESRCLPISSFMPKDRFDETFSQTCNCKFQK